MAHIHHKGVPVETVGTLPAVGVLAPDFVLTKTDLSDVSLKDFAGRIKVLSINPSLDTGTCATSAKKFNEQVAGKANVVVLNVSCDLPFAARRFCEANGLDNVVALSEMRNHRFGEDYGVRYTTGPLMGILSRAIVIVGTDNKVLYTQQVSDSSQEPDYAAVWRALGL
jgi:thiol peroxidase